MQIFLSLIFLFSVISFAKPRAQNSDCASIRYRPNIDFCIYNIKSQNPDIIYYLHHAGGSHESWGKQKQTREFYKELKSLGVHKPTVVSISLGQFWLMTDLKKKNSKSLQDFFAQDLVPYFEKEIESQKKTAIRKRYLMGVSMGGYNSLVTTLKNPELFDKVAVACPALPLINQFSSQEEINNYVSQTGADPRIIPFILKIMRKEFETQEDIERNNPFNLVQNSEHPLPPMYITVGDKDEFGIFEAVRKFASIITLRASELIFKPIANGGHCSMDTRAVVEFLAAD